MSDTFDKSSTLKIDGEVLNRSSFGKNGDEKLFRRVGNDISAPLYVFPVTSSGALQIAEYNSISSLAAGAVTTILSYTVPAGKTLSLKSFEVSGTNIATYNVEVAGVTKNNRRTYFGGGLNATLELNNLSVSSGTIVRVRVIHSRPMTGDFEATLLGALS